MNLDQMKALPQDKQKQLVDNLSKIRAKGKSTNYACLPMGTEVLTNCGWVKFDELSEGDSVMSYNTESDEVVVDSVLKKHFYTDKEVFSFNNDRFGFQCTNDHRWYGWRRGGGSRCRTKVFGFFKADEITTEHNIIMSAKYCDGGQSQVTELEAEFVGYLLSDGYFKWSSLGDGTSSSGGRKKMVRMSVAQSINKYCAEIESCLQSLGVVHSVCIRHVDNGNDVKMYNISSAWARGFLDKVFPGRKNKHEIDYVKWVLGLSKVARDAFYEAFYLGDGEMANRDIREVVYQNRGNIQDAICLCMFLGGSVVTLSKHGKDCVFIRAQRKRHITCSRLVKKSCGVQNTFCLTTNTGTFIIRQGDLIMITGNCQYGSGAATIARTAQVDLKVAKKLHAGYWKLNWSIKKIAEIMQVKTLPDGSMWQKNPINGFWYSLRTEKDRFSTLIQGLGSYILDIWLFNVFRLGKKYGLDIKLLGQFHKHHCGFVW